MASKGNPVFHCVTCGKDFEKKQALELHSRVHSGEKPFMCDICSRRFPQKGHLEDHLRRHKGEKKFKCGSCAFKSVSKSGLTEHVITHSENRPSFKCPVCEKTYKQEKSLRAHGRIHSGERKPGKFTGFPCGFCRKSFSTNKDLTAHQKETNHSGSKCEFCGKQYLWKDSFRRHLRIHLVENYMKCQFCSYRTVQRTRLNKHEATHNEAPLDLTVATGPSQQITKTARPREAHQMKVHDEGESSRIPLDLTKHGSSSSFK